MNRTDRNRRTAFAKWVITVAGTLCVLLTAGFVMHSDTTPKDSYPKDYFINPVDRQILLSGTFGELRTNHFHAGLDIKSKDGSVGEPLIASGPGFVSRISVQAAGYGNVIYIDHPNGYTTVYAHLDRFTDTVARYIKSMQYELKRFEVNLYPRPDQFVVKKGETIGYLGNTGSSSGPHVHFEIRKTSNQLPINPLLFGFDVRDDAPPGVRDLRVYHLDQELHMIRQVDYTPVSIGKGRYILRDTLVEPASRVGFALKVYDQMTGASNQNGIYALDMSVDDIPQYAFELNSIPFSQTRYLNAHIDYHARQNNQGYYHRCFRLPGNALEIYDEKNERGILTLQRNKARKISVRARDKEGNVSELIFYIKAGEPAEIVSSGSSENIDYLRSHQINTADLQINFEPHTFYQNIDLEYIRDAVARPGFYAPIHHLHPEHLPVHRYYDMTILSSGLPEHLKSKAFIAEVDGRRMISWGGVAHGDHIYSRVRGLGDFTVAVDTISPDIVPVTFRQNMHGMSRMTFRIGDSQRVTGLAEGLFYEATVNGQWILMEYEAKRATLTHWFDERIGPGTHELVLTVRDDRGNETKLVRKFIR